MGSCKRSDFRSGLEFRIACQLEDVGVTYEYEQTKVPYQKKVSKYTPDFELPNGIIVEAKGRFVGSERTKHLMVKAQHPQLDIRFVFSNSEGKLYKGSTSTYADWCNKHGFLYHDEFIPNAWLRGTG